MELDASKENKMLREQIQNLEKEIRKSRTKQTILLSALEELTPQLCPTDKDFVKDKLLQVRLVDLNTAEIAKEYLHLNV